MYSYTLSLGTKLPRKGDTIIGIKSVVIHVKYL